MLISMDIAAETIPKIATIELYESEVLGRCAGLQILYSEFLSDSLVHYDYDTNYCKETTITIGADQYLSDVLVATDSSVASQESIAVKFKLNDATELECGTPYSPYVSLIQGVTAEDEIAVIALSGALNDNQPQGVDLYH